MFHLVYGKEALLPIEVEFPSVRILIKLVDNVLDTFKERMFSLEKVQLDKELAFKHYEQRLKEDARRANAKVKEKNINKGDLVLRYSNNIDRTFQKKF